MHERLSVVTRKGQVTLPVEIRRSLDLRQGDKVAFRLENNQVFLVRSAGVTQATEGVFRRFGDTPRSAEELRILAEQAIADDVAERTH
ncbi:MAG TPA: AbrB/MazE/SpoVT family DNA-binding domain-containing protein [Chloroflexota bacterium]|nr:AbrB/MazE/SpoVT family DNA-binding domain-containing protein [Chloroflexota bacterium]